MCTVTIFRGPDSTLVTMNRDEARGRAAESPPALVSGAGGPSWLAPTDGEKGGTWFGVNDRGIVACLLNAYVPGDLALYGRPDVPSRGTIIPELLGREPDHAVSWLRDEFDPSPYPSFTVVLTTPKTALSYAWRLDSGVTTSEVGDGWSMVTSSLWRTQDVVPWRHRRFDQWLDTGSPTTNGLPGFNLLVVPDKKEWSPFTTRSFSMTRSITQAEVKTARSSARMRYWLRDGENAIDPARPSATHTLPLCSFLGP
jgi:hypothetical protein